jgi:hypothetical protein
MSSAKKKAVGNGASASASALGANEKDDDGKARLRRELQDLEQEMEIARFATNQRGQMVRIVPKSQCLERTRKRKTLEKLDQQQHAINVLEEQPPEDGNGNVVLNVYGNNVSSGNNGNHNLDSSSGHHKRLRGSKAAWTIADQDHLVDPTEALLLGGDEDEDLEGEEEPEDDEHDDDDDLEGSDNDSNEEGDEDDDEEDEDEQDGEDDCEGDGEDEDHHNRDLANNRAGEAGQSGLLSHEESATGRGNDTTISAADAFAQSRNSNHTHTAVPRYGNLLGALAMEPPPSIKNTNTHPGNTTLQQVVRKKKIRGKYKKDRTNKKKKKSGVLMARAMYRLKNFSSRKLAERHGLALGAHARGQQQLAVKTLAEVAEAAPIAPQVYSSLGLLYENLFLEDQDNSNGRGKSSTLTLGGNKANGKNNGNGNGNNNQNVNANNVSKMTKLELGQKAYAAYHVAAVLCKRDFTLWVRCGDAAMDLADLFSQRMLRHHRSLAESEFQDLRDSKKEWLLEALQDYDTADRLRPPGITVPAKLAHVHMELGHLSEALTILTDLRHSSHMEQQQQQRRLLELVQTSQKESTTSTASKDATVPLQQRSELDQSYKAWMLYADLMLRIGYECHQWDKNLSKVDNYMFKRWLRKYHKSFDWRERRLQALCLALEAAVGSNACSGLTQWLKDRAKQQRYWAEQKLKTKNNDNAAAAAAAAAAADPTSASWNVNDTFEAERQKEREQLEEQERLAKEHRKNAAAATPTNENEDEGGKIMEEGKGDATALAKDDEKDNHKDDTKDAPAQLKDDNNGDGSENNGKEGKLDNEEEGDEDASKKSDGEDDDNGNKDDDEEEEEEDGPSSTSTCLPDLEGLMLVGDMKDGRFEEEKLLMKQRHRVELNEFDAQGPTRDGTERVAIIKWQRTEWVEFIGRHIIMTSNNKDETAEASASLDPLAASAAEATTPSNQDTSTSTATATTEALTTSASADTVYDIASQLLKHVLGLKLYTCGRLVGEAVAHYSKERYTRRQKRLKEQAAFQARSLRLERDPLQIANEQRHDEPQPLAASDAGDTQDDGIYLSDDDILEDLNDNSLEVATLKQGALPPELCYLCGLCMVGEGGRDYLARQMLDAVDALPPEEAADLDDTNNSTTNASHQIVDTQVRPDAEWIKLEKVTRKPVKRFAALVYLADMLTTTSTTTAWSGMTDAPLKGGGLVAITNKAEAWAGRVIPLFEKHVKFAEGRRHLMTDEGQTVAPIVNQTFRLKLLLFMSRMKLFKAKNKYQKSKSDSARQQVQVSSGNHSGDDSAEEGDSPLDIARSVIQDMEIARGDLWRGLRTPDGKVCRSAIEVSQLSIISLQ